MTYLSDRHADAVAAVESWIAEQYPGFTKASVEQLGFHRFDGSYEGWVIPVQTGVTIVLAVDARFPFSRPKTAFSGLPQLATAAHVEAHLRLCTWGDGAMTDTGSPAAVADAYIRESIALLAQNESDGDPADFATDFEAYWRRTATVGIQLQSIVPLRSPSRLITGSYAEGDILLAETAEDAARWVKNRYNKRQTRASRPAALIWMDPLPQPDSYPTDVPALRALVEERAPDGIEVLDIVLSSSGSRRAVLLAGTATSKRAAAGGIIIEARTQPKSFKKALPADRGFRKGKMPPSVIAMRSRLRRIEVQHVEASQTRLETGVFEALRDRKVAVLGCGSLGAGVARLLAQSGVGRLLLVDGDTLRWENIGRHELGANEIGQNKATSLATCLRRRLPHLLECEGHARDWISLALQNDGIFDDCDVVMSAMGDWVSESGLDDFMRSSSLDIPTVYCWLERRATAAHALALQRSGPCFKCGFDRIGNALRPATAWAKDDDGEQCGAGTSPYGATELNIAQSLASGLIIDLLLGRASPIAYRVWLGRTADLERQGGEWSEAWKEINGDPGNGGLLIGADWLQSRDCNCA